MYCTWNTRHNTESWGPRRKAVQHSGTYSTNVANNTFRYPVTHDFFGISDNTASNGRKTSESWKGRDFEGIGRNLCDSQPHSWTDRGKPQKSSIKTHGAPVEIQSEYESEAILFEPTFSEMVLRTSLTRWNTGTHFSSFLSSLPRQTIPKTYI